MDDRTAIRAHGVFDVVYVKNRKIINLDSHLDRLFNSANSVNITPPFNMDKTKEIIIDVVKQTLCYYLKQ